MAGPKKEMPCGSMAFRNKEEGKFEAGLGVWNLYTKVNHEAVRKDSEHCLKWLRIEVRGSKFGRVSRRKETGNIVSE